MKTYTTAEAAELFKCSERWLIEQIRANRFPASKIGRHWVMSEQDVSDALQITNNGAPRPTASADPSIKVVNFASMTPTTRRKLVTK